MAASIEGKSHALFGTDGIRGVAGKFPLDPRTVFAFGEALGQWAANHAVAGHQPEVLIGMDTRESGPRLSELIAGGLIRGGAIPRFAGLISTPGVAWLTKTGPFAAGVMISASHNPFQDNGLKVFDHSGFKLPDDVEHAFERRIFANLERDFSVSPIPLTVDSGLDEQYLAFLRSTFPHRLDGLRIVLDCGHGASVALAPRLFSDLGADVVALNCEPNGRNINEGCGALHVEGLAARVVAEMADYGVAFDGDADRAILVAASGKIIDGDAVLLVTGRALKEWGRLGGPQGKPTVVATVMSNLGLENALRSSGIDMLRTGVGDKYVLEEMVHQNAQLGGEQSGHIIFREFATTGDGMMTALRVLEACVRSGRSLDELTADLEIYPQVLLGVRVRDKVKFSEMPSVVATMATAEADFGVTGRILVRYSGTEALARVMAEGSDLEKVNRHTQAIADAIRAHIGAE